MSTDTSSLPDTEAVARFLTGFHDELCQQLSALDGKATFIDDAWTREEGGGGLTRILTDGNLFDCLLYTSPSPRDQRGSRMPSSA